MYIFIGVLILVTVWLGFLTRIFHNLRNDRNAKMETQIYFQSKIKQLKDEQENTQKTKTNSKAKT